MPMLVEDVNEESRPKLRYCSLGGTGQRWCEAVSLCQGSVIPCRTRTPRWLAARGLTTLLFRYHGIATVICLVSSSFIPYHVQGSTELKTGRMPSGKME